MLLIVKMILKVSDSDNGKSRPHGRHGGENFKWRRRGEKGGEHTLASQTKSTPIELEAGESDISMVGSCSSIVTTTRLSSLCTREEMYTPLGEGGGGGGGRWKEGYPEGRTVRVKF